MVAQGLAHHTSVKAKGLGYALKEVASAQSLLAMTANTALAVPAVFFHS
jgi:hypothetical protein